MQLEWDQDSLWNKFVLTHGCGFSSLGLVSGIFWVERKSHPCSLVWATLLTASTWAHMPIISHPWWSLANKVNQAPCCEGNIYHLFRVSYKLHFSSYPVKKHCFQSTIHEQLTHVWYPQLLLDAKLNVEHSTISTILYDAMLLQWGYLSFMEFLVGRMCSVTFE